MKKTAQKNEMRDSKEIVFPTGCGRRFTWDKTLAKRPAGDTIKRPGGKLRFSDWG
jgi:hypothetical protein